jgi:hypothetical protein
MNKTERRKMKARWYAMVNRCHNPNSAKYTSYGGRGIFVCQRWRESFEAFASDVGACPGAGLSLDRIDNNGNYEPGNVRWSDAFEQAGNRRKFDRTTTGSQCQPTHCPVRTFRVPDDEWQEWQERARSQGTTVTALIHEAMARL